MFVGESASIKILSSRNPIFVYQLTVVGNGTMQLSKVTVLDNYRAVYTNVVNRNVGGSMSVHVFLHSNPLCVSLV